ncbi:MAG: aldehyde dehydrogenase family protein [Pseudomonadales bacterium]|jgi:coniferyl-aldehyde dehydrogenase|nr:aldehyde dehydrogenase family protein [Gammaproteobacteria bacterium]MBP6050348.1 aldehyde dehydrogenase family protein [Pseudomonadales bacterium]MBK7170250.1 aldehyde dehydrogenase family protein [Gammaproteobacteria bacterium]MBK7522072.1 aldehyde dehydrogenase family protein [Gammaproteobacteria bacterium]MBK8309222.1 aldehyde dehydrogenase family protein [Gammaproteobacteria bacterium]
MSGRTAAGEITMATADDQVAIERLHDTFKLQQKAFHGDPDPSTASRVDLLKAIPPMMMKNAKRIAEALASDFGHHPELTAYMFDVLNVASRAEYVANNVARWVLPQPRELEPHLYGRSRAWIEYQPKGVIGNLSAWNFPVDLSIGPLTEMLAAGNRVIIKPSEQVPATAELMAQMIAATFDRDQVSVATGGLDLARAFSTLKWDHLLYTGNARIGREVMLKAARNLVPVTLELGGKSPTVFTEEALSADNVRSLLGSKLTKGGQLCICVDHVFVPEALVDRFVAMVRETIEALMGDFTTSELGVAIINRKQFDRVQSYVDDARARNRASVIEIGSATTGEPPFRMPLTLVLDPELDSLVCTEEIFGPVLPIIGYRDFDEVIERIRAGDKPLGVYIFSENAQLIEKLRRNTRSGGFTVNAPSLHGAQESLAFGGVGESGMGRHHGFEGFCQFSNPRAVFELGAGAQIKTLYSPHGEETRQFVKTVSGGLLG